VVRGKLDLLGDVVEKLMYLRFGPDILALIIRYDVKAFSKCLFNAIFVVLNTSHDQDPYR
jgi:hypothetical protein